MVTPGGTGPPLDDTLFNFFSTFSYAFPPSGDAWSNTSMNLSADFWADFSMRDNV